MIQPLRLPDSSHLILAQRHAANILLQPAGHAPLQMRVEIGGERGAALVIFSALNPCQKLQRALAAEIVQNRFRIRGKLIWMMLLHYQAVERLRAFLGDAADQTDVFMVQLFQRSFIAAIILANQLLVGHDLLTRLFLRRTAPRIGRSGDPAVLVNVLRGNTLLESLYGDIRVAQSVIEQIPAHKIPLNDLTTLHLQQFYKKLLAEGRVERIEAQKQPKGLSAKTVRNIHQIISSALKLAVEQRLIAHNPADGCALPKAERKEMQTLPVEQLTSFLREAKDSGVFALYYIDLTTGLRRGELLGLKWSDIDLEKGDLRVQRQIGRIDGKIIEMPLKTKNAYRTLPLSADAIDVLMQQRRKTGNSEWVFPSPTGDPMSPDSVLHMLHRVLKRAGLPKVRFHDLRHTFATLALQNGVDIKTVSGMLGHFSAGFTLDTYAHVTTSAKREAAKTMGNILSGAV